MHHAILRGGAIVACLACCASLAACAGTGGGTAPPAGPIRLEGWYQGRQIPLSISSSNCRSGRPRDVWFEVENGAIQMRHAPHRRNARKQSLMGSVSPDGGVTMRHGDGSRSVAGRIEAGRLTAATVRDAESVSAIQAGGKAACGFHYEARRIGPTLPPRRSMDAARGQPSKTSPNVLNHSE